jgi:Uma2 family endonuclease
VCAGSGRAYAEAGIPEYWVVDCTAEAVEVHRDPGPEGYREVRRLTGPGTLALPAFPDVHVTTAEIFA